MVAGRSAGSGFAAALWGKRASMAENGRTYFDRQEVRDPNERERSIFHALPGLIRHAIDNAPFFREHLAGLEPDSITSRAALADIPLVRHAALAARQQTQLPFGGLAATATGRLAHLYAAAGPLYGLEGSRSDYWRFARAMYAAGFRRGDVVLNTFDYHLVPDGFMADFGARAMGCPVIPAGSADLDRQVRLLTDLAPVALAGRPSTLQALLDRAAARGVTKPSLQKALLAFEPLAAADARRLGETHGIAALQCYATTDLGLVAYQSGIADGFIVDESMIVEIVDPATGRPLPPGQTGELVVTAFNPDYPLIRFATGDLTKQLPGESPCGRTNMRLAGVLGRVAEAEAVAPR
jgi:phenylacetate-CoA ligase